MEPSDPVPLPVSVPGLKPPLARELNEVEDPVDVPDVSRRWR